MSVTRHILLVLLLTTLAGCATTRTLEENAERAIDMAVNPEERELHYLREGNTLHYYRRECSGKYCKKSE